MSNNSKNTYNQICRYLNGEMETEEKTAFEKELENNESLHHEFMKVVTQTFEKKRIENNINELQKKHPVESPKTINFHSAWVKAVAAIIIIAIVVGGFLLLKTNKKPDTLLIAENLNYSSPYVFRNSETNDKDMKLSAHMYFSEKQFKQAAELFGEVVKANENDEESKFYFGLSLLSTKEEAGISKSIDIFEGLLNSNRFEQQSNWFLGLALYESGQPEKAKVYFQKIVDNGWSFQEKAKVVLSEAY
ncbi:MAG: hypothetical protein R2764_14615 [Bacteroidales bacterium]